MLRDIKNGNIEVNGQLLEIIASDFSKHLLSEKYETLIKRTRLYQLFRWSYYSYKYATGFIIASSVANSLLDNYTLTKEQYIDFLSSGSSLYSLDLLKKLNIDFENLSIIESKFEVMF